MLKKLFFWNYERNTWQWDVLCVVILIFIFLTPKKWFENGEQQQHRVEHQNTTVSTLLIGPELVDNAQDKARIEQLVRTMTNRPNVEVVGVRAVPGNDGKPRGYEVDIR